MHSTEILNILSWPVLIFASYIIISLAVKKYERKYPQKED